MFGDLREIWKDLSAKEIIEKLEQYAMPFLAIHGIANPIDEYGNAVGTCILRLVDLRRPSSTYPFVMQLLKQFSDGQVTKVDVIGCLETVESFLVRRAICGIEPTGLLGLFRTMWSSTDGHPTATKVGLTILKRLTVEWPTDQRLREAIRSRPIYESSIAKYVAVEYDRSLGIDHPSVADLSLEHVMPNSYCDEWSKVVSKAQHSKLKHLWANLVPLSKAMNQSVDQSSYATKKSIFAEESMYISARRLAERYGDWGESEIMDRTQILTDWSINRWKRPNEKES